MFEFYSWVAVFLLSILMTYFLRAYAVKKNVIDIPNARSSHSVPTPRGGGVAVVLMFLAVLGYVNLWLLFIAGALVALIGWLDDHGHVKSIIRLMVHLLASVLVVYAVGGMPELTLFGFEVYLGLAGGVLGVLALTWVLNLYNFMDGIDGIAGVEVVSSAGIAGLILWFSFGLYDQAWLHFYLVASALGFLIWNWPPAKIFMGDAGSGFLGLMLGGLALQSSHSEQAMLWVWLILLGVFIVDATYTLIRRLLRGDKVFEAHRSHAYQYASRKVGNHRTITLAVLMINLFWLAPWAVAVGYDAIDGAVATLIAYLPVIVLAWYFHAGELELPEQSAP